jgi:predicted Zn-dependent protease
MNFQREESWFLSSEGADIHQTKYSTGAGYTAYAFAGSEIQKRSYPNSFGGQWQNRGYEQIEEMKLLENAAGWRKKRLRCTMPSSARKAYPHHSGWIATGFADSRIHRASD